jgi:hypothetical protein
MKRKTPLQGEKHILWDSLVEDITKFRQYLNFVDDKSLVARKSLHGCTIVNETLLKRPLEITQNAINLINEISSAHLQTLRVKDRTIVTIWVRKIIGKLSQMRNVQPKADQMKQNVQSFKDFFG